MALGNVFMTDIDGNIGSNPIVSVEGVCGLLFDISAQKDIWTTGVGTALASDLKNNVVELNSLNDAVALGITKYTGESDESGVSKDFLNGVPYYHISQFFGMAGGSGRLFIAFADCSSNWNALIDMQKASGGIISQFGVWTEQYLWKNLDNSAATYSTAIVGDLESVAKEMADNYFAPASILLLANTSKVSTNNGAENKVVFSKIPTCVIGARYVSVLLSQSMDNDVKKMQASFDKTSTIGNVGLALGILSSANVGHSLAWVGRYDVVNYVPSIEFGFGDSEIANDVLTNATSYTSLTRAQLDSLDDKGYIFLRTYEGLEGHVYFTKDQTCSNGDYSTIARNRTINKSRRSIRNALLPYVNSPVKVDPANGNLSGAQITIYKNLITNVLNAMATAEEISAVGAVNIPANQNVLVNKKLLFSYTIVPLGCAESIEVTDGLAISR